MWHIVCVAGDCDLGQLYVFSVYFLSRQENGMRRNSLEQLCQGPLNPPCPVQLSVWSPACHLPQHISQPIISRQPKLGHDVTMVVASLILKCAKWSSACHGVYICAPKEYMQGWARTQIYCEDLESVYKVTRCLEVWSEAEQNSAVWWTESWLIHWPCTLGWRWKTEQSTWLH